MPVLLLTKRDEWSRHAHEIAKVCFHNDIVLIDAEAGDPFPNDLRFGGYDPLLSFLCPWVLSEHVIKSYKLCLNFHPGSHSYPGIGCYNFALYDGATEYGPVCHHIVKQVDAGPIVSERLFKVSDDETVQSLKHRTMIVMLDMFHDIIYRIRNGEELPKPDIQWTRKARKRQELNDLCIITPTMNPVEVKRRIRATSYHGYAGAHVYIAGHRFDATTHG